VPDEIVRDEVAPVHVRFRTAAERGAAPSVLAQQIAGRHVWDTERLGDETSLSALAGTWPTDQQGDSIST